jgi:lycopene cyclase domain-containing protein
VGEYTLLAITAAVAVVAVELLWLRTGLLRKPSYALTMLIVFALQVPVDGWLTKLSAPIVLYNPDHKSGVRFPWDIPVEDFLFGFALLTLVLLLWERDAIREQA